MKRILLFLLCLFSLLALVACGGQTTPGGEQNPTSDEYTVTFISENACASVTSANPVTVKAGETATFRVKLSDTAVFRSTDAGRYDYKTRLLTVPNVTKDTRVRFFAEDVGYDTTGAYHLRFVGGTKDTVSHADPEADIQPGTRIAVTAGDTNASFIGWTAHAPRANGGTLLSEAAGIWTTAPHLMLVPALVISLLMISFNLFGNGLRDALNPGLRGAS